MSSSSAFKEALRIAELGYRVFPCDRNKRPMISGWPKTASTDPKKIENWFSKTDCLVAILTGPEANLFVVDIDPKGMEWLAENEHRMQCERIHETRRGKHFLYRHPQALNGATTNTVSKVSEGVDTRGKGGYIIWWPAEGFESSGDLDDLTEPASWLTDSLVDELGAKVIRVNSFASSIPEGGRNNALASFSGSLWARGASKESMEEAALLFNEERNNPPLPSEEVRSVVNSISKYDRKNDSYSELETEDSFALDFVKFNPDLRYVSLWGKWMRWNQNVWVSDDTLGVFDLIRKHVRLYVRDRREFLNAHKVAAIEKFARADRRYAATVDQWDADDLLLNTPKGIVGLSDGSLRNSDPGFYMSKCTIVAPGDHASRWREFLNQVTDGDPDYQAYLQRVIGYAASGSTHEHAMFFLYGEGGNGKGIFLNTIQAIMGDYAKTAPMEAFTESKSDRHPADMAMLQGARMVFAQETESGKAWAESRIKSLTGGDPITARFMRQDFFTFVPKFKLLISGNHMPKLQNVDEAMRRRLHLLPFTRTFKGEDRDPHLAEKLHSEFGGILSWIIDGAAAYDREGLAPPRVVQEATNAYFESEDIFQQWLAECCELEVNAFDNPTKLFESFKAYTEGRNEFTGTNREFSQRLEKAGYTRGSSTSKGGRFWQGLRIEER